jgi:hypothetical protein
MVNPVLPISMHTYRIQKQLDHHFHSPTLSCRENRHLLRLLSNGVNPEGAGRSLYFSYFYDITLNAQRTAVVARDTSPAMQTAASRAEHQFFWNGSMSRPLIDAGAHRWDVPIFVT